ncbi:MAG: acetyltransferase [Desulfuromonadaceae bacterium]|nr:acetyltransferase [Desulfuromonadaceae bacterium]
MSGRLVLFPFGGNARESLMSVFAINEKTVEWEIMGFIDDDRSLHGKECCGIKVLGGRELLKEFPDAQIIAVPGSPTNYLRRKNILDSLPVDKSRFATIIHPSVGRSPDATIGYNTIIMSNVVISCGVTIGNHCVILPNTVVSHDSAVGDYCCIGSNVSISGSVHIDPSCYIGSGTKIREDISIGSGALVGLGSNVISDIPAGVIAVGSPAKVIRKNND